MFNIGYRKQNRTRWLSKLALLVEDYENITFEDITDTVTKHFTKLKKRFTDYFPDFDINKCNILSVPEDPPGLAGCE